MALRLQSVGARLSLSSPSSIARQETFNASNEVSSTNAERICQFENGSK
jgi:hypothetical protein